MSQAIADDRLTLTASAPEALPAWLRERKRQDHATFAGLPMPDTTMEDWRRTDIGHVVLSELAPPEPGDDAPALELAAAAQVRSGEGGALLLQAGGATHTVTVPEDLARQGVVVASLEAAATTHADLVRRCLDQEVVPAAAGKFAALNAAFWRGGVFVHVPRGVVAALPVWTASTLAPSAGDARPLTLPRALVVVEAEASLIFTDEYVSAPGTRGVSSAVTEVVLGDGASIQYLVLQRWADDVDHVATHRIHLGRDCSAELVVAATGARLSKTYMEVALAGPGSNARISGLIIGGGQQHFDYQSLQDHFAPNCTSDLLIKGALRDSARSVYSGLIKIRKDAQHSDAYQANRNLLLSHTAKADSIPKLEIEANDVRCTHGATMGQVDPEQVFYLESRGIPTQAAQNLVVHGFFQPVIDRIALPAVRDQIHEAIDAALVGLDPEAVAPPTGTTVAATSEGAA